LQGRGNAVLYLEKAAKRWERRRFAGRKRGLRGGGFANEEVPNLKTYGEWDPIVAKRT